MLEIMNHISALQMFRIEDTNIHSFVKGIIDSLKIKVINLFI